MLHHYSTFDLGLQKVNNKQQHYITLDADALV